jgi:hypothetical protein
MLDSYNNVIKKKHYSYFLLIILFSVITIVPVSAAETSRYDTIPITISSSLDKVIFDGKWSFGPEWKKSSLDTLSYPDDEATIILRTAHQDGFLYVHIDAMSDIIIDKGADNALVCVDGKNNKSVIPDGDDYCFSISLNRNYGFTYQGKGATGFNGNFQKIDNNENVIMVSNVTDKNNRYNKIVHSSYEFKIPLSIFEKNNEYGFYVSVFDSANNNLYSWPYDVERKHLLTIPSPSTWGIIYSPDNTMLDS